MTALPLPLLTVALGGNALSPPAGDASYATERAVITTTAQALATLAARGYRLLVVHGNGPQVGRLLHDEPDPADLDIHVAQTQGELGYLIAEALEAATRQACAALTTRVIVDPDDPAFAAPTKPIGPVLAKRPDDGPSTPSGSGYRRVVASPRPVEIIEVEAIGALLVGHHVIAGGGGGVPLARRDDRRIPTSGVIDKDWVAARLAIAFDAAMLCFATNVDGVLDHPGATDARCIRTLDVAAAQRLLTNGTLGAGSMSPKVESAVDFVAATHRNAVIASVDALAEMLDEPPPGTRVVLGPLSARRV